MKKALFFLLLLGAGLLLLYWFEQRARNALPTAPPLAEPPPTPDTREGQGIQFNGASSIIRYDAKTNRALLTLKGADTRTEGDIDTLTTVSVELFDPANEGVVQARLNAERGHIRRLPSADKLHPNWEWIIHLEGVEAQVISGFPLAPFSFRSKTAVIEGVPGEPRRVHTDDEFTARSPVLSFEGRGLDCRLDEGLIEIAHAGHVVLRSDSATPGTFATTGDGPLQVRGSSEPNKPVELEAWQGALLALEGANPGSLRAKHILLRARPSGADAKGSLSVEQLDADGDVDWSSGDSVFQGQRVTATFAPSGRLEHALLDGLPVARLALALTAGLKPEPAPAPGTEPRRQVTISGERALDITWHTNGFDLSVQGLSTVETPDFRLKSATGITGFLAEDRRSARFAASGGVEVESGDATLEAAAFEVSMKRDAQGETELHGKATGGASLVRLLPPKEIGQEAQRFTLSSPDGLEIERTASGWHVLESTHVTVALEGPDAINARADRVTDLDVARSRFTADGNISVTHGKDTFGGEHLEFLALEPVLHFTVSGTKESKAFYTGEREGHPLEATALSVEVTGNTLVANGDVRANGETARSLVKGETGKGDTGKGDAAKDDVAKSGDKAGLRWEFSSDALTMDGSETPELIPGERLRSLRTTASGNVHGTLTDVDQTIVLRSQQLAFEQRDRRVAGVDAPQAVGRLLTAEGNVHATVLRKGVELQLDCAHFEGESTPSDLATGFRNLVASGDVHFQGGKPSEFSGECELLVYGADGHGSLEPAPNGRVMLIGHKKEGQQFRLTAERIDFDLEAEGPGHITAQRPEIKVAGRRAHAEHLSSDGESSFVLTGGVHMSGTINGALPLTLDANEIQIVGRRVSGPAAAEPTPDGTSSEEDSLDSLVAEGAVDFHLSQELRARGAKLAVRRASGLLRIDGAPATFETPFARLETEWIEFDPILRVLVATGRGKMYSLEQEGSAAAPDAQGKAGVGGQTWSLDFLSTSSLLELDSLVFVIQEPVFHTAQFGSVLRASWAVMWLNREAFKDSAQREDLLAGLKSVFTRFESLPKDANWADFLALFRTQEMSGVLRELYFEGPVEVLSEGRLLARSDAFYFDAISQRGWLERATMNISGNLIGREDERLIVKADWLRLSSDGKLRADHATVTSCSFDEPHVRVVTGDLRIDPLKEEGKAKYRLLLKDNRAEFYDWFTLPLPTIDVNTNKKLEPLWPTLSLADSARFGTFLSFAFTRPAGSVAKWFDKLFRKAPKPAKPAAESAPVALGPDGKPLPPPPPPKPRAEADGHYKVDGSLLGSRGALLDLGLEIEAKDDYWFDLYLGLVYDNGEDKGFVRVDPEDRSPLRHWLRSQGYFANGKSAWTVSYTDQSDAGVQSEFFEGRFVRYERSENYVQWHESSNENFLQGTVKLRTDDFRTDIDELPSLSGYRGRSPLLHIGSLTLLHTGDLSAEYLRRREGQDPQSPFGLPTTFPDGLGDREVLRVDTTQTLELPVPVGAGWKVTPFVSGRGTGWSQGEDEGDSPTRLIANAGARLGTTFWKRSADGKLSQIAPFVEVTSELTRHDSDGIPVEFDAVETALSGDFVKLGSRARFAAVNAESALLDVDVVGTYARNRSDGRLDGWMPLEVIARMIVSPFGQEFEIYHDGRYDVENSRTVYSLLSLGTHLGDEWGVQASHQRGLDASGQPLFEAASVSGLYRWTEKWEFEARESFSLLEGGKLDSRFHIRRYGHDMVMDLESGFREGEGSTVGISVSPRFGYHPSRVGYVPW